MSTNKLRNYSENVINAESLMKQIMVKMKTYPFCNPIPFWIFKCILATQESPCEWTLDKDPQVMIFGNVILETINPEFPSFLYFMVFNYLTTILYLKTGLNTGIFVDQWLQLG